MSVRRPRIKALSLVAFALTFVACGESEQSTSPIAPPPPPPVTLSPAVSEFVELMNAHRTSMGLAPLAWDAGVAAVAQAHSEDMVARSFFSHTNPDGESPFDRLSAAGITYTAAGENIAYGYPTASSVLTAWLGSDGHRRNIENANYTHHGVGLEGTYWTHVFIRKPAEARAGALRRAP
jgi:uncharacterized protein YkwD